MNQTLSFRHYLLVCLLLGGLTGCSKIALEGVSPSLGADDAYTSAFYANLISAGMSSSNAAFVSGYTGNSASAFVSNLLSVNAASSDTVEKAKSSSAQALGKVSDNDHFPGTSDKKDAVEIIAQAQFATLADMVDEADLSSALDEVTGVLSSDIDETGLTNSDLEDAVERQAKGIARGLIDSSVDADLHDDLMASYSKAAVESLLNNPNLASSGVDIIAALTEGLLGEIGNDSTYSGDNKGQIISEILKGIQEQINADSNLSDDDKADYISEIYDNAGSLLQDSSIVDKVQEGLFSSDTEIHAISIYEAGDSSGWVPGSTSGTLVDSHWDGSATVTVASGSKPVVLVLTSYEGVNWTVTGATSRVSKVITHGFYDQFVSGVDASKVSMQSYESGSSMYFYGIVSSDWYLEFAEPWVQAFLTKVRQDVGAQLVSFQSAYDQQSFTVGDGQNAAGSLPALSFVRPWLYPLDYSGVDAYQSSGGSNIYTVLALTHALSAPISVRVYVENVTASSSDIPAFDHTYTLDAGDRFITLLIPFNQDNSITADKNFKIHIEAPDDVFTFSKVLSGVIHGGTGSSSGGSSGGGSTSGTTTVGGSNTSYIRSQLVSISVNSSANTATVQLQHTNYDPYACTNVAYTYNVVLDTTNSLNAAFVAAYPSASNQWLYMTMGCASAPVKTTNGSVDWYTTATYTYPSGCTVNSFSASSQPSAPMCL